MLLQDAPPQVLMRALSRTSMHTSTCTQIRPDLCACDTHTHTHMHTHVPHTCTHTRLTHTRLTHTLTHTHTHPKPCRPALKITRTLHKTRHTLTLTHTYTHTTRHDTTRLTTRPRSQTLAYAVSTLTLLPKLFLLFLVGLWILTSWLSPAFGFVYPMLFLPTAVRR